MICFFKVPNRRGVCQGLSGSCLKLSLLSYGVRTVLLESCFPPQSVAETVPPVQGLWDGFEGRGFASWLPNFYEGVASALGTESKWCSMALPDLHPRLLLLLLSALFSRIDKPFRTRLASALVQGNQKID